MEDGSFKKPSRTLSVGQTEQGSAAVGAPLLAPNGGAPGAQQSAEIEAKIEALSMQMASFAKQAHRTEARLEQLVLAVTAQGPRQKSRAREGPPRERRDAHVVAEVQGHVTYPKVANQSFDA